MQSRSKHKEIRRAEKFEGAAVCRALGPDLLPLLPHRFALLSATPHPLCALLAMVDVVTMRCTREAAGNHSR